MMMLAVRAWYVTSNKVMLNDKDIVIHCKPPMHVLYVVDSLMMRLRFILILFGKIEGDEGAMHSNP